MGKTLDRIKADPRVSDAFTDSDGTWIYLKAGWGVGGRPGEHIIVEDRASSAAAKLRGLVLCRCAECVKGFIGTMPDKSTVYHDGRDVYRAAFGNVVDVRTGYLIGRFECSVVQWNAGRHAVLGLPKVAL